MNNTKLSLILLLGIAISVLLNCESKNQNTSESTQNDSLLIMYTALQDSVDNNWRIMIADDDDKHMLMKRLLLEVSYTNNYDKTRFIELNGLVDQLKEIRYDQKTMANSSMIDAYDSASWDLSDQIIEFARDHPRYEDFPLMEELIQDINAKNNYILILRIHYDSSVKELNSFVKHNSERLKDDASASDLEQMPLFELSS